jgi:hypothetical protein
MRPHYSHEKFYLLEVHLGGRGAVEVKRLLEPHLHMWQHRQGTRRGLCNKSLSLHQIEDTVDYY